MKQKIGQVYLLHFSRSHYHARHYLGWAEDAERRIQEHMDDVSDVKLIHVVNAAGITLEVAKIWDNVDRHFERKLKKQGGLSRHCPICKTLGIDRDTNYRRKRNE